LPLAYHRDPEGDCPYYYGQKIEPRCGIDAPLARLRAWLLLPAAESFYVTEVRKFPVVSLIAVRLAAQQIETAVRGCD